MLGIVMRIFLCINLVNFNIFIRIMMVYSYEILEILFVLICESIC